MSEHTHKRFVRRIEPVSPQWAAFLELGFRPLYLAGTLWAATCVAIWIHAPTMITGTLSGVAWHAHEMLWGFVATIGVGFLLTAGTNWTGLNPLKGQALAALTGLWLLARLGYLSPHPAAFWTAAFCESVFFAWAALALARVIHAARSRRNYGVPVLVVGLGAANVLYLAAAWQGDQGVLLGRFHAGLLCMAVLAMLIARRVIPFFAGRAVPGLSLPMHTSSGQWQLVAGVLAIAGLLLGWSAVAATALAVSGALTLWHVFAWRPWAVRHNPLLWVLYVGYAALGIGLLVAAAHEAGFALRMAWPAHLIGMAGFGVLIIGMVTRTALGHLGRPLRADLSMQVSYVLVIAAAVLRLVALPPSGLTAPFLYASSAAWMLAFAVYLWRFFPMLIRPRADSTAAKVPVNPQSTTRVTP